MDLLTSGEEVLRSVGFGFLSVWGGKKTCLSERGCGSLVSGELPGTGAWRKGDGLCVQTGVLSLTLTDPVSVTMGSGAIPKTPGPSLYL